MGHSFAVLFVIILAFALPTDCRRPKGRPFNIGRRDKLKFLHVSDVHYTPFYNKSVDESNWCDSSGASSTADYEAPYGRIGCDSPAALWLITLDGMKEKARDAKFIMLAGDSAGHGLTDDFGSHNVLNSLSFVSSKAHEVFPEIPVFPAFGNNDLPGHYILPNNSDWYKTVLTYWAPLILCEKCPDHVQKPTTMEALAKTFIDGGYYSANIADGKMILLVLNTMYWNDNRYTDPLVDQIAESQMQWFNDQLQMAKNQRKKVLIMSHIPPGGDPYGYDFFWLPQYLTRYVSLVAGKYHDIVAGQFYAHTHRDDFHLQILDAANEEAEKASTKSFVIMTASISPVYSNNPAFKVFTLRTDNQALVDYDQYYLDLVIVTEFSNPVWKFDYTFSRKYPSRNKFINADRIDELNQELISQTDGTYWKAYIPSTTANYQTGSYDRLPLYCIMRYVFEEDFKKCHEKFKVLGG